jgi:hypothetical protein
MRAGRTALLLVSAMGLQALLGCGGTGGSSPSVAGKGAVRVAVRFPAVHPTSLPEATRSVVFSVYASSAPSLAQQGVVERPLVPPVVVVRQSGQETVSATIRYVPAGWVLLRAEAYDSETPPLPPFSSSSERKASARPSRSKEPTWHAAEQARLIAEAETRVEVVAGQTRQVHMVAGRLPVRLEISGPDALAAGAEAAYSATGYDADGQIVLGLQVSWETSDASILALLDRPGQVRALRPGQATLRVTASLGSYRGQAEKTITISAGAAHIEVEPAEATLQVGQSLNLTARVLDAEGKEVPGVSVSWATSCSLVASVTASGRVTAHRGGATRVCAHVSLGSTLVLGFCDLWVGPPAPPGSTTAVSGRVTDSHGHPLPLARVETSDGEHVWSSFTDAGGLYRLGQVPFGGRVFSFAKAGYAAVHRSLAVGVARPGVSLDVQLERCAAPPSAPPRITANDPVVDNTRGDATFTGTITNLETPTAVLIVNGAETAFEVGGEGSFRAVAILQPGANVLYLRALNGLGSALVGPFQASYTPPSGEVYFRVTLTWDQVSDRDLHVLDPNGEECYFGNMHIGTGELDHDNISDPPGTPENFTCTKLVPGRYVVWVYPYSGADANCMIRVHVARGPGAPRTWDFGPRLVGNTWYACDVVVEPEGRIHAEPHQGGAVSGVAAREQLRKMRPR